jgi:hypothetical protein
MKSQALEHYQFYSTIRPKPTYVVGDRQFSKGYDDQRIALPIPGATGPDAQ